MQDAGSGAVEAAETFKVINPEGRSPILLLCDHASNFLPARYGTLGLSQADLSRHIAWDPGAAAVARIMAQTLDATLVESTVSRLVVDCNRALDAPNLICDLSETTTIPGNQSLSPAERAERIAFAWQPFHDAVTSVIENRQTERRETVLVAIHSFTPVYKGVSRPWHVGVLHDEDTRLAEPLIERLGHEEGVIVGDNQPYSPADRVYFTLEMHGRAQGLSCVMLEIRNDMIADQAGVQRWAAMLAQHLAVVLAGSMGKPPAAAEISREL